MLSTDTSDNESPYTYALRDSTEYSSARNEVNDAWKQWKTGAVPSRDEYQAAQKRAKIIKNSILRTQREKQWRKTEQQIRENPGHIFKLLRKTGKKANRTSERPSMVNIDGETTTDPEKVAEQFHDKWSNILGNRTQPAEPAVWLKNLNKEDFDAFLKSSVSVDTLRNKLKDLKKNKAAGDDEIHNEYLTHLGDTAVSSLCTLINNIIKAAHIPENWRNSITTTLYK